MEKQSEQRLFDDIAGIKTNSAANLDIPRFRWMVAKAHEISGYTVAQ